MRNKGSSDSNSEPNLLSAQEKMDMSSERKIPVRNNNRAGKYSGGKQDQESIPKDTTPNPFGI